jgi:hypothetical protein
MYPHRIRLVGPWEAEPLAWFDADANDVPPSARRVVVPVMWEQFGFANGAGVVLFRRKFGLPRKLDEWERVWVVPSRDADIEYPWQLNSKDLRWIDRREDEPAEYAVPPRADATAILRDRNELTVRVQRTGRDAGSFGGAALDIGCRAYICRVRVQRNRVAQGDGADLRIDVVSESADDPLEIYALVDGTNCGYLKLRDHQGETAHRLRLDDKVFGPATTAMLRVDLVNRATIWDTAEMTIESPG